MNQKFKTIKVARMMIKFWEKSNHPEKDKIIQVFKDSIRQCIEIEMLEHEYRKNVA